MQLGDEPNEKTVNLCSTLAKIANLYQIACLFSFNETQRTIILWALNDFTKLGDPKIVSHYQIVNKSYYIVLSPPMKLKFSST